jgi:hypothetical protein
MSDLTSRIRWVGAPAERGPWTLAGGADLDFDDADRSVRYARLTDPDPEERYRRHHPDRPPASYDEMIRELGDVWDCPHDGTATVTGFRCPVCGRGRAAALHG